MSLKEAGSLVVDASVAVKWYLPEVSTEVAVEVLESGVRGERRLVAPSLLAPEVGNVLWLRHRRGDLSVEDLRRAWTAFEAAPLVFVEPTLLMPAALEIAVSCDCTVYDALYVALAEAYRSEHATVVTADRRLLSKLAGTPFADLVKPLTG